MRSLKMSICKFCQNEFIPNKYRPQQIACSDSVCQKKRQLGNLKAWREKNPYYFTYGHYELDWKGDYKKRARDWRSRHPDYMRQYAQAHKEERRQYMREYMRRRRSAQKTVS